jgi:DNA repair exonuclease SbcCD nuclease subunit
MLKLAVLGDRHVSLRSPRYQTALAAWDWAIDDAIAAGATVFVGCGDVCEGDPNGLERVALGERYERMRNAGAVFEALGNHEHRDSLAWLRFLDVTVAWDDFVRVPLEDGDGADVWLVLSPYPRRGHAPYADTGDGTMAGSIQAAIARLRRAVEAGLAAADGDPLLVAGHWAVAGMRVGDSDFELHATHEPIFPVETFAGAALVLAGHVHKAQEIAPNIVGVGALYRTSFGEAGDTPSYTLVTVEAGRVSYERRAVPANAMTVVRVSWPLALDALPSICGAEVKVSVEIAEDQVATFDPSVFEFLRDHSPLFVLEKIVVPTTRTRAPEVTRSQALGDQLGAWAEATGQDIPADRRERLAAKVAEIE